MIVKFDPDFVKRLKKLDIRIRKSFKERLLQFSINPHDPQLNNHPIKDRWQGYRSIDITADWRAIYKEIKQGEEKVAYFVAIDTHKDL